jgi:thymidylate synthase (FAD)
MNKGHTINVLDKGYVQYIDSMGDDTYPVRAARMSTSGSFVSWEPYEGHPRGDQGILEYLYKNQHNTPFEMGDLILEVKAPIFVFRQWQRHRTQSFNEFSARYSFMPDEHYVPALDRVKGSSASNKQGSGEPLTEGLSADFIEAVRNEQADVYQTYESWSQTGVANELSRINTPVSRYSKMWAKANLRNWLAFETLRLAPDAQWEVQEYAKAVADIIKALWPRCYGLFEKYTLEARSFTKAERDAMCQLLLAPDSVVHLKTLFSSEAAYKEFMAKLVA